jgi:hypothetical protein
MGRANVGFGVSARNRHAAIRCGREYSRFYSNGPAPPPLPRTVKRIPQFPNHPLARGILCLPFGIVRLQTRRRAL